MPRLALFLCLLASAASGGASVTYIQTDTVTLGNWKGVYGQDGNVIAQHSVMLPPYSMFNTAGNINLNLLNLWATDPRALLKQYYSYSATERVESYFHTGTSMDFLVGGADGQSHRIALYFGDYENKGRSVTVQVLDSASSALLDSRPVSNYGAGLYLVYNYSGDVTFRIVNNTPGAFTPTGSVNAFFWGGSIGVAAPPPPSDTTPPNVSVTSPTGGSTVSGTVAVTASATDTVGVASVQFQLDANTPQSSTLSIAISPPYTAQWNTTIFPNGGHQITAVARDAAGNTATSSVVVTVNNAADTIPPTVSLASPVASSTVSGSVNVTVNTNDNLGVTAVWYFLDGNSLGKQTFPYAMTWDTTRATNGTHTLTATAYDAANNTQSASINVTVDNAASSGASVTFLGTDTTTRGNWKGVYGQDGNVIAQHSVITPSYSTFDTAGEINLSLVDMWATDPRALLKQYYSYSPSERIESYWSTLSTMDFVVSTSDGMPHRIALYFADYENQGRLASLRVLDASNNNTLDFHPLPLYSNPVYLVYTYTGKVIFRVVNQHPGPPAAALSAFFWGGSGLPQ
jgi:hypothetical protein